MWDPEASYKAITLVYRLVWIIISACECYTVDYNDWYILVQAEMRFRTE